MFPFIFLVIQTIILTSYATSRILKVMNPQDAHRDMVLTGPISKPRRLRQRDELTSFRQRGNSAQRRIKIQNGKLPSSGD